MANSFWKPGESIRQNYIILIQKLISINMYFFDFQTMIELEPFEWLNSCSLHRFFYFKKIFNSCVL